MIAELDASVANVTRSNTPVNRQTELANLGMEAMENSEFFQEGDMLIITVDSPQETDETGMSPAGVSLSGYDDNADGVPVEAALMLLIHSRAILQAAEGSSK